MPGTFSQVLLHVVFSTKQRRPWFTPAVAERLYPYLGGIVRAERGTLYDVGGVEDHVHLYLRWRPDGAVSDLMRTVKARSSKWVHETFAELGDFAWQVLGFGAPGGDDEAGVAIGREIVAACRRHGLETAWNGTIDQLIGIRMKWQRRV
ncbi:MAG: transposase [Phycisphaerales bacterium]|nr:transposase [Phycisphaerales bacterium]